MGTAPIASVMRMPMSSVSSGCPTCQCTSDQRVARCRRNSATEREGEAAPVPREPRADVDAPRVDDPEEQGRHDGGEEEEHRGTAVTS